MSSAWVSGGVHPYRVGDKLSKKNPKKQAEAPEKPEFGTGDKAGSPTGVGEATGSSRAAWAGAVPSPPFSSPGRVQGLGRDAGPGLGSWAPGVGWPEAAEAPCPPEVREGEQGHRGPLWRGQESQDGGACVGGG